MAQTKAVRIEKERTEFRSLLAQNPNYFGNFPGSKFKLVKSLVANTKYEEVTCLGYNPKLDVLEATIHLKLAWGYGGGLCLSGSTEFVRFYVDYGDGWEDVGAAAVDVYDIPGAYDCAKQNTKPLSYVLTQPFDPKRTICWFPMLPRVRAILSWNSLPPENEPDWNPVWGNVLERSVQIKPRFWIIADVLEVIGKNVGTALELPPQLKDMEFEQVELPEPPPPTLQELAQLYGYAPSEPTAKKAQPKKGTVEPHRFGFTEIVDALSPDLLDPFAIQKKIEAWGALKIDWGTALGNLIKTSNNTSYEELTCIGLDYNREWLIATIHIKRPSGYSGGLCQKGSLEYVAFWADWEDVCEWSYLGTANVRVHDISAIPDDGLHYTVFLKINLDAHRRKCNQPKIGRVRAVLSWNAPPSIVDPDAIPHWGNRLDTHVLIKPGQPVETDKPVISILGGIGRDDIFVTTSGLTKPHAKFALTGTSADPWSPSRECPFGGRVVVQGRPAPGRRYRLWVRQFGSLTTTLLDKKIWVVDEDGIGSWHLPDPNGFFDYLPDAENIDDVLGYWDTGTDNGMWLIRLEMADSTNTILATTMWHRILLDNTIPDAAISIDSGECEMYVPGTTLTGRFVARDPHFGRFVLNTLPTSLAPPSPIADLSGASSGTYETAAAPGDSWHLNTSGMSPCGYVIRVRVWDRTIRNSSPGHHNFNHDDKGLCLLEE